jgi:hypothetical protein
MERAKAAALRIHVVIRKMKIVTSARAESYIREHGGAVWVWLDPHRGLVGAHIWLEAHCEPPRTTLKTKFTRASRRPHRFQELEYDGVVVNYDFGRMESPDELHLDRKGWRRGSHRLEAYWNGCVFVGDDVLPPDGSSSKRR